MKKKGFILFSKEGWGEGDSRYLRTHLKSLQYLIKKVDLCIRGIILSAPFLNSKHTFEVSQLPLPIFSCELQLADSDDIQTNCIQSFLTVFISIVQENFLKYFIISHIQQFQFPIQVNSCWYERRHCSWSPFDWQQCRDHFFLFFPFRYSPPSTFLIEGVLKSKTNLKKVEWIAQKPRPCRPFLDPWRPFWILQVVQ